MFQLRIDTQWWRDVDVFGNRLGLCQNEMIMRKDTKEATDMFFIFTQRSKNVSH